VPLGATLLVFSFLGYVLSRRTLMTLRRNMHLTIQRSVHRDLNKMYKKEYNGQTIEHPFKDADQMMH